MSRLVSRVTIPARGISKEAPSKRKPDGGDRWVNALEKKKPYVTSVSMAAWPSDELKMPLDANTFHAAVAGGVLDVLKWLRSQDPPCPWDADVCRYAAGGGHLDVLQWARSQDPPCPWNAGVCWYAAENGHLDVLQWARSQVS